MLHPDLKVNGKPLSREEDLERFFTLDLFSCDIGHTALEVEFSPDRAAFLGWIDEYNDDVYYFDNGSGRTESVDLCINGCPEERMMCYDANALRDIVLHFCRTGERHPDYCWIEDIR